VSGHRKQKIEVARLRITAEGRRAPGGGQMNAALILRRASASRSSGVWNQDDFDVLADGAVVGRIMKSGGVTGVRTRRRARVRAKIL
jgi:hypothetical protein